MSQPNRRIPLVVTLLYVGFVTWSLYGAVVPVGTYLFRMLDMAFNFALAFLAYPTSKEVGSRTRWLDVGLAILGVITIAYPLLDLDSFIRRSTLPETVDFWLGIAATVLLVEISRRTVGTAFTLVLVGFLLYTYLGKFIPGALAHKGYDLDRIVGHSYMTLEGIFGVPLSVSVSFVTLFVVYGTLMGRSRSGELLAGDVAGRDGARPCQRRPRRRHHHRPPGRPAGQGCRRCCSAYHSPWAPASACACSDATGWARPPPWGASWVSLIRAAAGSTGRGRASRARPRFEVANLGIGFVPEDRRIFADLTVWENLDVATRRRGAGGWTTERVFDLFPKLRELSHRQGGFLSGGEQQMLTIAGTLMGNPELLLLDEPSEGLAPLVVDHLKEKIARLKGEGLTILLAEQNVEFSLDLAERVYVLEKGRIRYEGSSSQSSCRVPRHRRTP